MRLGLLLRIQPTPFLWRMQYFLQKLPRVPQRRRLQTLSQVRLRLRPKRAATLRNSAATQRLTVDTMTCFPAFGLSWLVSALRFDCRHCDMPRAQSEIPLQVNRLEWVHYGAMSKGCAKTFFFRCIHFVAHNLDVLVRGAAFVVLTDICHWSQRFNSSGCSSLTRACSGCSSLTSIYSSGARANGRGKDARPGGTRSGISSKSDSSEDSGIWSPRSSWGAAKCVEPPKMITITSVWRTVRGTLRASNVVTSRRRLSAARSSADQPWKPAARSGIRICATACQREVEGSSPSSSLSESTRRRS